MIPLDHHVVAGILALIAVALVIWFWYTGNRKIEHQRRMIEVMAIVATREMKRNKKKGEL